MPLCETSSETGRAVAASSHKGPNIASIDPGLANSYGCFTPDETMGPSTSTAKVCSLVGRTAVGRATVMLLAVNHPDYVLLRESLIAEGRFPPT
jgi:hypothetical protein